MAGATGFFRLENGMVLEMDLPLAEVYASRVKRGEIVQVGSLDGEPIDDDAPSPVTEPDPADGALAELVDELEGARADLALTTTQRDQFDAAYQAARAELETALARVAELEAAAAPPPAEPTKAEPAKAAKASR